MKTIARGPEFCADPRDVLSVPDDTGRALIAAGSAEQVADEACATTVLEVAVAPAESETATAPTVRPARKGRR